jgi:hypothetical protein
MTKEQAVDILNKMLLNLTQEKHQLFAFIEIQAIIEAVKTISQKP